MSQDTAIANERLDAAPCSRSIVVCGLDRVSPAMMMAIYTAAAGLGEVIVLPPHIQPKQPQDFEILKAAFNPPLPLPLWQSQDAEFVRPHSPLDFFLA
mgnify:CR=1 FL=1